MIRPDSGVVGGWGANRYRKYSRAEWVSDEAMLDRIVQETRGLAEGGRVVELGCGLGHVAASFAAIATQCIAVDHDAAMLRQAKSPDRVEYVQGRIEEFTCSPGDVVLARNVVHYVGVTPLFSKAAELLRRGGMFLVCQAVPPSARARPWHDAMHDMMGVARAPSTDDLVAGFRQHGFHSISATFHFHRMNLNRWLDARVESPDLRDWLRHHHAELTEFPEYEYETRNDETFVSVRFAIVTGLRT